MANMQVQDLSHSTARLQRTPIAACLAAFLSGVFAVLAFMPASSLTSGHLFPVARAAAGGSTSPIIHWDEHMIYAGHNNGYPLGPVGEHAIVHAERFPAGTYILKLVSGDVVSTPDSPSQFCKLSTPKSPLPGTVTVGAAGTFDSDFRWPADANSGTWSICAYVHQLDGIDAPVGNIDDGPFSVLAPNPPAILLSASSITAGSSVTVTGQNFVTFAPVIVGIYPCFSCGAPAVVTANIAPDGSGSFAQSLTIPATQPAATLYAIAISENGVLDAGTDGSKTLTVTAPVPTATTAPTATTVPPTAVAGSGSGGKSGGSSSNNSTPLLITFAVLVIVLLAALGGTLAYVLTRRRPGAPAAGSPAVSGMPPYSPGTPPPGLYRDIPHLPMPPDEAPMTPVDFDAPTDPNIRFPRS